MILGPIFGLGMTASELGQAEYANPQLIGSPAWAQAKSIAWITFVTQAVLSIYAGYRLTRDFTPSAVRYAITILWFNNLGINILSFGALALIPSFDANAVLGELISSMIAGFVPASIWTAYLLLSKRVRNTYYARHVAGPAIATPKANEELGQQSEPAAGGLIALVETTSTVEPVVAVEPTAPVGPKPAVELYDRRFDWLLCFALVLIPIWALYGLMAAVTLAPAFLLVALLKPLKGRIGSLMGTGIFAAGFCLLVSPLLQIVFDIYPHDDLSELLRILVLPITGLGLMANSWLALRKPEQRKHSILRPVVRWGAFPIACLLALAGLVSPIDVFTDGEANAEAFASDENVEELATRLERERREREEQSEFERQYREFAAELRAQTHPQNGIRHAWLVGAWAPVNGRSSNPATYCGTDLGYTFNQNGRYETIGHHGSFSIVTDGYQIVLSDRLASEMNATAQEGDLLATLLLDVERSGEGFIIDGELFGRCR